MDYKKITVDFSTASDSGTRKRKKTVVDGDAAPLKMRPPPRPRDVNRTMKRHALLKFIRRHQESNYQKMMQEGMHGGNESGTASSTTSDTKTDLDDTLDYLMGLTDQVQQKEQEIAYPSRPVSAVPAPAPVPAPVQVPVPMPSPTASISGSTSGIGSIPSASLGPTSLPNHTLKRFHGGVGPSPFASMAPLPHENVSMHFPAPTETSPLRLAAPAYGCLKGGQIPTYRTMMRQQAAAAAAAERGGSSTGGPGPGPGPDLKYVRQKRTNRRTYKVGKSPTYAKVGVLISNRTLRKDITTQSYRLKQTPMSEIRRFLTKHGLIKTGTTAPNDVLRKMYESSKMLCGEVYNHNTDILLHNFVHGDPTK
jgi:hypothetical protein